jgi:hypothetical protein
MSSLHVGHNTTFLLLSVAGLFIWGAVSDERTSLSSSVAAGLHQRIILGSEDSWAYFTISDSRLYQPGRPGLRIYTTRHWGPFPKRAKTRGSTRISSHPSGQQRQKSKSCYDWRSVSQSVCLGVKFTLELVTRYYFLSESCCVAPVGRPLWR